MTTEESQLPPHIAQRLNDLHMAHISAVIAEQRAALDVGTANLREVQQAAWKARCAFYAYTSKLSGGVTGT